MKRAPFIGAVAAVALNGAFSGTARAARTTPKRRALVMVPAVADPIPAAVLARPILGEARRFDGTVAPHGWMLAQGQQLAIGANRALFEIFGTAFGGNGRTTFALPAPGFGAIVAVTGSFPSHANVFAQAGRHQSLLDSLGPGAMPARPRRSTPLPQSVLAARALVASAPRVTHAAPKPLAPALAERIAASVKNARETAFETMTAANRERLETAVADAVAGRTNVYGVVQRMAAALSEDEALRLLAINDSMTQSFNSRAGAQVHANARLEAGHFLASIAIGRAEARAIYRHESAHAH
jgi:microcystin-dependent protein